jgi:hypothetical protein
MKLRLGQGVIGSADLTPSAAPRASMMLFNEADRFKRLFKHKNIFKFTELRIPCTFHIGLIGKFIAIRALRMTARAFI